VKTIRELAHDLMSGRTTSVRIVEGAIARITEHRQSGGVAYLQLNETRALNAARASDVARAKGHVPSLLAGLPVSIKDLFDVEGEVTAAGSKVLAATSPAAVDAPVVARLRRAGAVLLGRTNMNEFAFSAMGLNPHYGTPTNPIDPTRVTGGSTSGGAVSVAGEMAVMALGTDTGGSIRIPAAFCGLTGFKPTASRVDLAGAIPLSPTLDSCGPLAGSVDCCLIADAVLSDENAIGDAVPAAGLRLGVTGDFVGENLDQHVADTFGRALALLSRAGCLIQDFSFPELKELPAINAGGGFPAAEAWAWHRGFLQKFSNDYDPRVVTRIRRGEFQSAADYFDLVDARRRLISRSLHRLAPFDAWLMPTTAVVPPRIQAVEQDDAAFFAANAAALRNPAVVNFIDGCALTIPCPVGGGLPVGLSVCGRQGDDARILQIGLAVERIFRHAQPLN
jgi:aspartyl-tRNA(Asn)/glutamyl-tRNA(Gln) amidotransferase subunit A